MILLLASAGAVAAWLWLRAAYEDAALAGGPVDLHKVVFRGSVLLAATVAVIVLVFSTFGVVTGVVVSAALMVLVIYRLFEAIMVGIGQRRS